MNLDQLFQERARMQPDRPAILGPVDPLSYSQLDAVIQRQADELKAAGVQRGECVGLHVGSGLSYLTLTYAIWRCGAVVVPVPVELVPREKRQILEEIAVGHLVSEPPEPEFAADLPHDAVVGIAESFTIRRLKNPPPIPSGFSKINSAFIRFTSGTTGSSKGVVLSHETIFERIESANEVLHIGPADNVVWLLSMSYHFAVSIVAYLTYGAGIILPRNLFAPAILKALQEHDGTFMYGSPLHYAWMKDFKGEADLSRVRLAISTTAAIDVNLANAFRERFGLPITQALGIIEIGLPCINLDFAAEQPNAVGRVLPAYESKLVPSEFDEHLFELKLRGPGMLDAYYHPWRTRDELLQDGWFSSGDVVSVDERGCLKIRGRSKDVINIAGMKFFPQEVEGILSSHPAIHSARVYSVSDPRFGEAAHAQVIANPQSTTKPTTEELQEWCRTRLAPYKVPSQIEFVESFPRTASGKVLHRKID